MAIRDSVNDIKKVDAVSSLRPTADWSMADDELTWLDGSQTEPTQAEIDAEIARLKTEFTANAYQRTRADAYKEVKEQLDQLYHDMTAGKLDATGEWHKAIKAVKDATPKP
jgi:flagellar biosynthesis/type III secretory pathway protein FliH